MKRKLKWTGVVLVVLMLGMGTALFLLPRDRTTAESWKQIRVGMTEKEVASLLGRPGMNLNEYTRHMETVEKRIDNVLQLAEPDTGFMVDRLGTDRFWRGQRGSMQIRFDPRGYVSWKSFWVSSEGSFLDRLRDWLGW